jgi:aspartyl aminopeptidase
MTSRSGYRDDFARFISASPSSYHAAAEAARRLDEAGFEQRDEAEDWTASTGAGRYYVVRDGAIVAWVQPAGTVSVYT